MDFAEYSLNKEKNESDLRYKYLDLTGELKNAAEHQSEWYQLKLVYFKRFQGAERIRNRDYLYKQ